MHKGRWKDNYKVLVITEHLRLVWFKPNTVICPIDKGFHFINGGGIRHISGTTIREIVW